MWDFSTLQFARDGSGKLGLLRLSEEELSERKQSLPDALALCWDHRKCSSSVSVLQKDIQLRDRVPQVRPENRKTSLTTANHCRHTGFPFEADARVDGLSFEIENIYLA